MVTPMQDEKQEHIRKILQAHTVGIAGAGGLGSNAAVSLARSGVGHLIVVDFDIVEKSNLNRQYYFQEHIGKQKVIVLQEIIKKIDPSIAFTPIIHRLQPGSMASYFKDADVIIEALDAAQIKTQFVEEIQKELPDKPLIAASGVAGYGQMDRITTRKLGNLYICYDPQAKSSDDDVLMASKVSVMANWKADLAIEILLGASQ